MTHTAVRSWRSAARAIPLLLVAAVLVTTPGVAQADTAPQPANDPTNPETYSARPLPTVQIGDGVVWSQAVIGNTVYVGGNFSTARPAGSAPGQNTVARSNLLAYDIRTGQLLDSWAPAANGEVQVVSASPDGSRVYVGGAFTTINGTTRRRIAALNPTTGALINSFNPNPDARVRAIAATEDTVYFGGNFSAAGGVTRTRVAAARASDGAVTTWAPTLTGGAVWAVAVSPDRSSVVFGGQFTAVNGSSNPGYGIAKVDAVTGDLQPFPAQTQARNGGDNGAITALVTDGDDLYISGYTFGRESGNLEGTVRTSWSDGSVKWVADCHGDTYDIFPHGEAVYVASHAHYCGNLPGGYHQNVNGSWNWRRGSAFSKQPTGVLRTEYLGYSNYAGNPAPSILQWFPQQDAGLFTGQDQASWAIDGNEDYVVMGGEFPRVDNIGQQGLVRYARVGLNGEDGEVPEFNGAATNPTVTSPGAGQALVSWESNWDRDNELLTYRIMRNGNNVTPAHTRVVGSQQQNRPFQAWLDTGLTPGDTVRYRIFTTDALGNEVRSESVETVVAGGDATDAYSQSVAADGPKHFWRFNEPGGNSAGNFTGRENLTLTGVNNQPSGAIAGNAASTFAGNSNSRAVNQVAVAGSDNFWYTVEAWFRTSTNRGGKIIGYGNQQNSGSSSSQNDRTLYMDNQGRILFGTRQGSNRTISSGTGLNNGQWHHAVGVVGDDGMSLYIDGLRVANTQAWTTGGSHTGYWRIGGDSLQGWTNRPSSDYFAGDIDEVAVYSHALAGDRVRAHYEASGRTINVPAAPADAYGDGVYDANPDLFWRLGETVGTRANDSSRNNAVGTHTNAPTLGGPSAIELAGDASVSYDGVNDITSSDAAVNSPQRSSVQMWFRTDTTTGGRLIGFGDQRLNQSGVNANDRVVYMTNDGRLRFGIRYQGVLHTIESSGVYNDNQWHQVVATHGKQGMKLYVDSIEVASGGTSGYTNYSGFWKVGGDTLANWPARPTSDFFRGSLDEVAVYSNVLSQQQISTMFNDGGGETPNIAPDAAFTSAVDKLEVAFDSSTSTDSDGAIASYAWDFGDGGTSTEANPTHVYAAAGTYPVTLTVTDNRGGTDSVTQDVVTVANVAPVASFSFLTSGLSAAFDGSGSSDADGSVTSYAWDFGDGDTSTEVAPVHAFDAAGTYDVELTVTDDDGAEHSVTQQVEVAAVVAPIVQDGFGRSVANGWGSAPTGGTYNQSGAGNLYQVNGGQGQISMTAAGATTRATLPAVSEATTDSTVTWSLDKVPNGGGAFISLAARANNTGTEAYRTKVKVASDGRLTLYLIRITGGVETNLSSVVLPVGQNYQVGDRIQVRMQTQGTSPTQLRAKLWKVGQSEPGAWQVEASDGTAALQTNRGVGVLTYLSGSSTNTPVAVRFDDLIVYGPAGPPADLPNVAPVADFTSTTSFLDVDFISTAADSDGTIASHAWTFGDGGTSTEANPSHTYAAAGTYPVTLTVTDDEGAESSVTKDVSVVAPVGPAVQDLFGRTVSNGWGSAGTGGAYNLSGAAALYQVDNGRGQISMATPGTTTRATLPGAGVTDLDLGASFGLSAIPNGGGAFVSVAARANNGGTEAYRTKVKIAADGRLTLYLIRITGGVETNLNSVVLPVAQNYQVGDRLQVRMQTQGTAPTQLRAKLWKVGDPEPAAWQVEATDGTAALQSNLGVGVLTYLSGSTTNTPIAVRFDDLIGNQLG